MFNLIFICFIIILFFYFRSLHLSIDFKSLFKKGFKKIDNYFGLYCYTGKQGTGKTYSAVRFLIKNKLEKDYIVITNVKSFNAFSDTIYFDKTGTLTKGNFEVVKVNAINISEEELIKIAAYAECYSSHPIALSIKNYYKETIDESKVKNPIEIAGTGIHVMVDDKDVYIGNEKLISKFNVKIEKENIGTTVYIVIDDVYCGYILIADEIKDSAKETINYLKKNDIKTIMLTGDNDAIAKNVSTYLGIDKYYAELLPDQKLKIIENEKDIAFVGDGINDAPALISADIGISMGTTGTDAAIEAADIVIMDDDLNKLEKALKISKKTLKIVKQNIAFSIFVKIIFLILGALGISNMMGSVFADVGVSIIAIINAMRTLKMK